MQAVARSRSPVLRDRSRSGSPRRQWSNDDVTVGQSQGARVRTGGQLPWKTEHQQQPSDSARIGGMAVGELYSQRPPIHRTAIREDLQGKSPTLGPDQGGLSESWEKMMTFRTYVIDRVSEETESMDAVVAYKRYKESFRKSYIERLFRQLKELPVIAEKYNPEFILKQFEESKQRCLSVVFEFMKLLREERFNNVSLVSPVVSPLAATSKPYRLLVGPRIAEDASFLPLSEPFYIPDDPDENSLCLRSLPSHISKWAVHEHLKSVGAADGLIDLTISVPDATELSPQSTSELTRIAWIKYDSDDSCAAAEIKLEGTNFKHYTCRPIRRIRDIPSYVFRVAPSETCHPARISRDLRLSARLIVKLDDVFGVSPLLGFTGDADNEILTEARCQQHPVLQELPNVLLGLSSRCPSEQLDLQLLYLRVVHCTCYYSGRRFSSPRELWENVGPLYVRPKVLPEEVLSLQGFSRTGDENWDSDYSTAVDIFKRLQQLEQEKPDPYDDTDYYMPEGFEPSETLPLPKDEDQLMGFGPLLKVEDYGEDVSAMVDETLEVKPIQIKTENETVQSRGRSNPWLAVLDTRITELLNENFDLPVIDDNCEEVQTLWNDFCKKNMNEVEADKWRCKICNKLFRGSDFVFKHLKNKHGDNFTPIVDQVKFNHMLTAHQNDHFRIPIRLPKPTPYLYRTALLKQQRKKDSPTVAPSGHMMPPTFNLSGSAFPSYMAPTMSDARLGSVNRGPFNGLDVREYKDLDAPKPIATANGNLRAAVHYDDL